MPTLKTQTLLPETAGNSPWTVEVGLVRRWKGCDHLEPVTTGFPLVSVDLKGNAQPLCEHKASPWCYAAASRDGRYLAIWDPVLGSNIWIIENF